MPRTHKAEEMTSAEFEQAMQEKPVVILTTGILEWHGEHLPLGTDALKIRGIAERLAERTGAILFPQNWFGVVGFDEMRGTVTFSKDLVKRILTEFFENLEQMGAKLVVLLTGHYGNFQVETITEAAQEFMAHSPVRIIAQSEYEGTDFSGFPCEPDHADKYETSLMMVVRPDLVHMDRLEQSREFPCIYPYRENVWDYHSPTGPCRWSPDLSTTASPGLGERVMQALLDHLTQMIDGEYARLTGNASPRPRDVPDTEYPRDHSHSSGRSAPGPVPGGRAREPLRILTARLGRLRSRKRSAVRPAGTGQSAGTPMDLPSQRPHRKIIQISQKSFQRQPLT